MLFFTSSLWQRHFSLRSSSLVYLGHLQLLLLPLCLHLLGRPCKLLLKWNLSFLQLNFIKGVYYGSCIEQILFWTWRISSFSTPLFLLICFRIISSGLDWPLGSILIPCLSYNLKSNTYIQLSSLHNLKVLSSRSLAPMAPIGCSQIWQLSAVVFDATHWNIMPQ